MTTTKELNLDNTQEFNEYIEQSVASMMRDILKHFCFRARKETTDKFDDDDRYLYNKNEVEIFKKMYENFKLKGTRPIAELEIETIYEDDSTEPWGYRIYRKGVKNQKS